MADLLFKLARPALTFLDPERAHGATIRALKLGFARTMPRRPDDPILATKVWNLSFPNPVGLAAGFDKHAEVCDAALALGFGFVEAGTVTPRPQPGNPRPRLFRIVEKEALINRLGFNNVGVDAFMQNVARTRWRGVLGINIGKNADTPAERAADDYEICLQKVYPRASYVTLNVSSPNTQGLRSLQDRGPLDALLARLSNSRKKLAERHQKFVPLVLKVAPDLDQDQVASIAQAVLRHRIDGVIATNTSVSREGVEGLPHFTEAGGLSGAPIRSRATRVLQQLHSHLKNEATLIGSGGIVDRKDAAERIHAGAALVQLYTGLIYRGPRLVAECVSAFRGK